VRTRAVLEATFALVALFGATLLIFVTSMMRVREAAEREAEAVCALQCVQEAPPDTDVRGLVHEWACICLTDERAWRVREGARVGSPPSWPATPR